MSASKPDLGAESLVSEGKRTQNGKDAGPLLATHGLDMAYGPVQVLFDVDFEIARGELVALLGTNGAGKSTLLKGICGLNKPKKGKVTFDGHDITNVPADATTKLGVSLMPGGKGV